MTHLFPESDDAESSVRRALKGKHILKIGRASCRERV